MTAILNFFSLNFTFIILFSDLANTGAGIQRKRTLAKSLRDSFRRLRSKRGSKRKTKDPKSEGATSPGGVRSVGYEAAPQTRLIDEQRVDEDVLSMVRCIYFGETFLGDGKLFLFNHFTIIMLTLIYLFIVARHDSKPSSINDPYELDFCTLFGHVFYY